MRFEAKLWCCWVLLTAPACGHSTPSRTPGPTPSAALSQTSYCDRLQPLLDKTAGQAHIGTQLTCLDIPGATALGRFGPPSSAEEASLADCFTQSADYQALFEAPEAPFELSIADAFEQSVGSGVNATLTSLVPWLPHFAVSTRAGTHLDAKVTIREARFVTLVGVASKLQGQEREQSCLEALCKPDATYVQKALVGVPTVSISATDQSGNAVSIGPLGGSLDFQERALQRGSRELSSTAPVTLAVARAAFRTEQTERLCQFCGKHGQRCCSDGPACDGGLGCVGERCVQLGGPGQPCDGESCAEGATCVGGTCHLECGSNGKPCCGRDCSGNLRCTSDPQNALEVALARQFTRVDGGILGSDEDRTFGSPTCGPLQTRQRFTVTKLNSARGQCDKAWWFDPSNEKDCRVAVHFSVSTLASVACQIDVFARPPAKPDLCVP